MFLSFSDILNPIASDAFWKTYHRQKPLYIPATDSRKFATLMGWEVLSALLSQNGIWSSRSLELTHQLKKVRPDDYCVPGLDRDMRDTMLPDLTKVSAWLARGASLVANDIATLTPALQQTATLLEEAIGGKAQANLYASSKAHPGFGTHFDTHDVFAFHIEGEKQWRVYQCPLVDPITHPAFKGLSPEFHEKNKGAISLEVTLKPGDLLYIPRGWYHDALATSTASLHVTFGVTPVIGLDLLSELFEASVHHPIFRAAVPTEEKALHRHMQKLGAEWVKLCEHKAVQDNFAAKIAGYRYPRGQIDLPNAMGKMTSEEPGTGNCKIYRLTSPHLKLVDAGTIGGPKGMPALLDGNKAVPVPAQYGEALAWVLDQKEFTEAAMDLALTNLSAPAREKFLSDLTAMGILQAG
jgi:bifunctional lysine-specific demethylase and histidyl-hydroxylase MINA